MATGGLYGQSTAGIVSPQSGSESVGLYGNNTVFGGSYFEWFIFQVSDTQPATPTGGSWSFSTNTGTPPAGWLANPPVNPTNTVWVSIGLVNSKTTAAITWSIPGKFSYSSGLPIISGSAAPSSGDGQTDQLYIQTGTTPETIWFKQAGTWTRLTGSSLYVDLVNNQTIAGTKTFSSQIQADVSGTATNITGIVGLNHGGTGSTDAASARTALGLGTIATQNANAVSITGGSVTGITDLAVADGGTGASNATDARTNLGVTATGADTTYAYRANNLSDLASASTARTNLGLGSAAVLTAGAANGVATLDSGGTVPLSQIPASIQGGVSYQGAWNASTNSPALTSSVGTKGYYYVVSTAGSTNLNGVTDWNIGDWAIFNGTIWQKIDNTDAVTSVAGRTGTVVLANTDISGLGTMSTQNANAVAITGGTISSLTFTSNTVSNNLAFTPAAAPSYAEGDVWYDSTQHSLAYYNDATNNLVHVGQEVQTKVINNTGSTITVGAPVYVTSTSSGQIYPNVALAKADSIATSSVLGLATNNIANGASGYVTSYGILQPCNTGLFNVGDVLYLSPYTAGVLMNTVPPTGSVIIVGVVAYKNSPSGSIYVKQQNSYIVAASTITGVLAVTQGGTGVTTSTGTGSTVLSTSPTLITPALGTPSALVGTNITGTASGLNIGGNATTATTATNVSGGTASVTTLTASADSAFTSTGAVQLSLGTTAQRPTGAAGKLRFNSDTTQFEGYNGTTWASVGGAAITNDTTTATNVYPLFANATSGTALTVYTSNAKYLYKPSTGELQSIAMVSSNGITVNANTVAADYTIAATNNGMSAGPITVNSGITVTISSGSTWVVV